MGRRDAWRVGGLAAGVAIALSCAGGCSSPAPPGGAGSDDGGTTDPTTWFASGTRLRAHLLDGGGGARQLVDWRDTKLGVSCLFHVAEDGITRCLPETFAALYYTDAACTQPVVQADSGSCGPPPAYVLTQASSLPQCGPWWSTPLEVLAVDPTPVAPAQVYAGGGSSCTLQQNPPSGAFYLTHPADPSMFVAAHESEEPRSMRLSARVLTADDGARQVVGFFDVQRQLACVASTDEIIETLDPQDWCVPANYAFSYYFADPTCTMPLVSQTASCPPPTVAVGFVSGACGSQTLVWGIGAQVTPTVAYEESGTSCQMQSLQSSGYSYFSTTGAIPLQEFPEVPLLPFGAGALQLYFRAAENGVAVVPPPYARKWHDGPGKRDCFATQMADRSWRCLPKQDITLQAESRYFSDAQCTKEIGIGSAPNPACPRDPTTLAVRPPAMQPACGPSALGDLYAVGAPLKPGTIYVQSSGGPCAMASTTDTVYPIGPKLDVASFPLLLESTE